MIDINYRQIANSTVKSVIYRHLANQIFLVNKLNLVQSPPNSYIMGVVKDQCGEKNENVPAVSPLTLLQVLYILFILSYLMHLILSYLIYTLYMQLLHDIALERI